MWMAVHGGVVMSVTVSTLQKLKNENKKFATITAYDATFARIFDEAGISAILIGDSLGMTIQGRDSTVAVTIDDMAYHTACVRRGVRNALILADMPFMTCCDISSMCANAAKLMRAGANVVKIEGGSFLCDGIRTLVNNGVPVCGHLGLTPQSVNVFGGYKVQGRGDAGKRLMDECLAVADAGASMIVLECVPKELAAEITRTVSVPVIGIGAGNQTDGQVLVMHDALGFTVGHTPKFAFNFLKETGNVSDAIKLYVSMVESGQYPTDDQSFN
jgi:3-methyl-2-oxobutanoate hydroxymethyltransferase